MRPFRGIAVRILALSSAGIAAAFLLRGLRTRQNRSAGGGSGRSVSTGHEISSSREIASRRAADARMSEKESRRQKWIKKFTRKRPLYDNCRLLAPNGTLLATCSKSKLNWYVQQGLGELVDGENGAVRLLFEPRGGPGITSPRRPTTGEGRGVISNKQRQEEYVTLYQDNRCVVCGHDSNLVRHFIVPRHYRARFPRAFKSHNSHDCVATCFTCHERASQSSSRFRNQLEKNLIRMFAPTYHEDKKREAEARVAANSNCPSAKLTLAKRNSKLILKVGSKIPLDRRRELEQPIWSLLSTPDIADKLFAQDVISKVLADRHLTTEVLVCLSKVHGPLLKTLKSIEPRRKTVSTDATGEPEPLLDLAHIAIAGIIELSVTLSPADAQLWWDTAGFSQNYRELVEGVMSDLGHIAVTGGANGEEIAGIEDRSPLAYFIRLWRQQFVNSLEPRYMPQHWSIGTRTWVNIHDKLYVRAHRMHKEAKRVS